MMVCLLLVVDQGAHKVYILYKEIGQFPATIKPVYSFGGRNIARVEDDTFNYLKGNVKVLDTAMVEIGANHYGKDHKKYYICADGSGFSSARTDEADEKVEEPLTQEEHDASTGLYKIVLISNVEDVYHDRFKALSADKPELESSTWPAQLEESKAYLADNTVDTPVLSILAAARGITVDDQASRVVLKEADFNKVVATLLGQQKALSDEIKAIDSCKELCRWNEDKFGIQMPMAWAVEFGRMEADGFTRKVPIMDTVKF
jgi:hypothetical protein